MTGTLTTLLDERDFRALVRLRPEAAGSALVVFDLELHALLKAEGVRHVCAWDFVELEDRTELERIERLLCEFWRSNASIVHGGVDLLQMCRHRHESMFARLCWIRHVVDRAIQALQPEMMFVFDESSGHGLEQPANYTCMPLMQTLVHGMAIRRDIAVEALDRRLAGITDRFDDHASAGETTQRQRANLQESRAKMNALLGRDDDRPLIAFAAIGEDARRQLPVIAKITELNSADVVQLFANVSDGAFEAIASMGHDALPMQLFEPAETLQVPSAIELALLRQQLLQAIDAAPIEIGDVLSEASIGIHWDFIYGRYAERMAWQVDRWRQFLERVKPSAVVVNSPIPVLDVALSSGVPAVVLPHGPTMQGYDRWHLGYSGPVIGVMNEHHRNHLVKVGVPLEWMEITGDPGIDHLMATDHIQSRIEARDGVPFRVLVVTQALSKPAHTVRLPIVNWAGAANDVEELVQAAAQRGGWRVMLKCHPRYDHAGFYRRLVSASGADRVWLTETEDLRACVLESDVVVAMNAVTSAVIEASLMDRPVILFDHSLVWWDHESWGTGAWPHASNLGDLMRLLERIESEAGVAARLTNQSRSAAAGYLGGVAPKSSRCAEMLIARATEAHATRKHIARALGVT